MPGVATTHVLYDERVDQWQRCRDCASGEDAVKSRKTEYLPALDSHTTYPGKYTDYITRALFYNATGRTIAGLSGAIFQKTPSIDVTEDAVRDQIQDVTLTDEPLELFALNVTREYLTTGRVGILVDMSTELATTPRPYWVLYEAENIVNWKFRNLGGDKELCLVVLKETVEEQDEEDEFCIEPKIQYRVLRLSDEGIYTQQVYTEIENQQETAPGLRPPEKEYEGGPILTPTRRGVPLDFIPFSLPWTVNAPPLLDLVSVNLSHYRGSADLKHGLHYVALPTPWVSGEGTDSGKPLSIGSGTAWGLGKDGSAGMLEFTGKGLGAIRLELQDLQRMMASLGARLLEEAPHYAETALSVSMRHSSDYATLRMIAQVVEQQLSFALKTHCWWLSTEKLVAKMKAKIELNKVFFDASVTADELRALLMALQAQTISYKTFYERLSNTGWTREGITPEEELKDIEEDGDDFLPPAKPGLQQPDPKSTKPGSKLPPKPVT
jgi:hypothetical protein